MLSRPIDRLDRIFLTIESTSVQLKVCLRWSKKQLEPKAPAKVFDVFHIRQIRACQMPVRQTGWSGSILPWPFKADTDLENGTYLLLDFFDKKR